MNHHGYSTEGATKPSLSPVKSWTKAKAYGRCAKWSWNTVEIPQISEVNKKLNKKCIIVTALGSVLNLKINIFNLQGFFLQHISEINDHNYNISGWVKIELSRIKLWKRTELVVEICDNTQPCSEAWMWTWVVICLYVMVLWLTGDLSKVYPASHLISAAVGQLSKQFEKWMDAGNTSELWLKHPMWYPCSSSSLIAPQP